MPSRDTFSIPPIKEFIENNLFNGAKIIDPFVRNSPFKDKCVSNDLDKTIKADYNIDALEFLKMQPNSYYDIVLFDPPYSPRQVAECYEKNGLAVNMETTQSSFWGNIKNEIERITKPFSIVISCGWNSGGIGEKCGFKILDILLVAHGGWHNDTIVTLEKKTRISLYDQVQL